MDANLKAKWIKALRSGKYKQKRGRLRGNEGFCCLGVLCDLVGTHWERRGDGYAAELDGFMSIAILPDSVANEAGLSARHAGTLADMNDGGKRFTTIAKWIEENL